MQMDNVLKRSSVDGILNASWCTYTGVRSTQLVSLKLSERVQRVVWGLCACRYGNRALRHHPGLRQSPAALFPPHQVMTHCQISHQSNMEDSRRTLHESFPVQAFKQQQSRAGWGLFPPQCYSTSTGSSNCTQTLKATQVLQICPLFRVCGITPRDMALSFT